MNKRRIAYILLAIDVAVVLFIVAIVFICPTADRRDPATFINVPLYPGAISVEPNPDNHDSYKEITFTATADFRDIAAFYENVLREDGWVLETTEPTGRYFWHAAHTHYFQYTASIVSTGSVGDKVVVRLTMICACYAL